MVLRSGKSLAHIRSSSDKRLWHRESGFRNIFCKCEHGLITMRQYWLKTCCLRETRSRDLLTNYTESSRLISGRNRCTQGPAASSQPLLTDSALLSTRLSFWTVIAARRKLGRGLPASLGRGEERRERGGRLPCSHHWLFYSKFYSKFWDFK